MSHALSLPPNDYRRLPHWRERFFDQITGRFNLGSPTLVDPERGGIRTFALGPSDNVRLSLAAFPVFGRRSYWFYEMELARIIRGSLRGTSIEPIAPGIWQVERGLCATFFVRSGRLAHLRVTKEASEHLVGRNYPVRSWLGFIADRRRKTPGYEMALSRLFYEPGSHGPTSANYAICGFEVPVDPHRQSGVAGNIYGNGGKPNSWHITAGGKMMRLQGPDIRRLAGGRATRGIAVALPRCFPVAGRGRLGVAVDLVETLATIASSSCSVKIIGTSTQLLRWGMEVFLA